ncbi:MAG: DUF5652 family protein [Pontimonas sp.]|jgi:hypothetical protein
MNALTDFLTSTEGVLTVLFLSVWTLVWKGVALYHAGKNRQKVWFVVLLLLNDLGILSMIYLRWFQRQRAW